ncbi:MAG: HEAT repeat domain-containing protein [Bdellovibrionia bacterium]
MRGIFFILAIAAGMLGFNLEGRAWSDNEIRASIEETLKIRHPDDTKDWWRSLGANTPKVIISIFKEDSMIYHQIRLVDALAWFDDPVAVDFLKEQALHHENTIVRRAAIRSIGLSQGVKEKAFLKQGLESSDPHTRLTTAKILNKLKDPAADRIVKDFLKTEKTDWISTTLKQRNNQKVNKLIIEGKGKKY